MTQTSNSRPFTILPATDTMVLLKALSPWKVMLDAIAGITAAAGLVTVATDQSGNGITCSVPNPPAFSATGWQGTQPSMQFIAAAGSGRRIQIGGGATPWVGPVGAFTAITVLDLFTTDGLHDANIYRDNTQTKSVGYINQTTGKWALYDGTVFESTFTPITRPGPTIRIDVHNGAASAIWANGTKQTGDSGTTARGLGTHFLGSNSANTGPMNALCPFYGIIDGVPSDATLLQIVAALRSRYTGIPAV